MEHLLLCTTSELDSILDDPDTLVIDARSFGQYSKGHIPGAVNLDLFAFHWVDTTQEGMRGFASQASTILSFAGVDATKSVVFYDDVTGMLASRGLWLLRYLSHHDVRILDGGLGKWVRERRRIQTQPVPFQTSRFVGIPNPDIVAGYEYVRDNIDSLTIIDARSPKEYDGTVARAAKRGHIPGAANTDWNLNIVRGSQDMDDGTLKPAGQLCALYTMPKDSEIVTYCQGGYRAASTFLALKSLGYENVRVYPGSWGEWGNRPGLPVEH